MENEIPNFWEVDKDFIIYEVQEPSSLGSFNLGARIEVDTGNEGF